MIRIPGWILGVALAATLGACGAGDAPEAQEEPQRAANAQPQPMPQPQAQPQPQPEARPEPEPEPPAPAASTDRLYTVQVAAFVTEDSVRMWADRLSRRGLPVWTVEATVGGRTFHRLRIGASPSLSEARELGRRIQRDYRWPVWVAPVEDNRSIPANAISRTHALVSGS